MDDGAQVILITRPRRFGKTLSLSMLYHFLQKQQPHDHNIFEGLNVAKDTEFCHEHQHQYPVIFVSFKDIKQSSYDQSYEKIAALMGNLYSEHRYLLEENFLYEDERARVLAILNQTATRAVVESAIKQLSGYLARKFGKPAIILIDEYDTPIQEAYLKGYYPQMIELMRGIFGEALKDNPHMSKTVITGITRVAQEGLFSGLNNIQAYSLLKEEYGQYFGFTEFEVHKFLNETGHEISMEALKGWYNGYRIGKHVVYNPWSIIGCLKNHGKLEPYWLNTASNHLIKELIAKADSSIHDQFELLLQGKSIIKPLSENLVFTDLDEREEAIWSLLLYAGYLNVLSKETTGFQLMAEVAIPNREVMYVYNDLVADWFRQNTSLASYKEFVHSLSSGKVDVFKRYLADYIMETGSYFDFNKHTPERVFHSFMLGLVVGLKDEYIIQSNQESGRGRLDVIFIPKTKGKDGILLEFKTSDTGKLLTAKAQEALAQIKNQQYMALLKAHNVSSVLAIGLAFCGKQVELAHEHLRS
jgi:hypothetical protein